MRTNAWALMLFALLISGGGCLPSAPVLSIENTVDSVKVSMTGFDEREPVAGAAGCAASASYPVIEETPGLKEEIRTMLNADIETQAALYFDAVPYATAKEAAEAFLKSCAVGVADVLKADEESFVAKEEWNSDLTGEVLKNGGGILSIALTNTSYTGGAHPGASSLFLMFDLGTGERLTLSHVLSEDQKLKIIKSLAGTLAKEYADALFPEQLAEYEAFLKNPSQESAALIMEKYGEYALTDGGVQAHFDEYEIAPYAAGPIDITIPL